MRIHTLFYLICFTFFLYTCGGNKTENQEENNDSTEVNTPEENAVDNTPKVEIDKAATARAEIMGGIELGNPADYETVLNSPAVKQHYTDFNAKWAGLEAKHLSKIRPWRDEELKTWQAEGYNLFYPFSGPDFLNAYLFFPNCDNYLLFGLEPNGKLVDVNNMPEGYLASLRNALDEVL